MRYTTDIWFAMFLKMEGYSIVKYDILSKNKGKFYFDISMEDWMELKLKCDKSTISEMKAIQTSLKDLLH
jgi:hypothetical protein